MLAKSHTPLAELDAVSVTTAGSSVAVRDQRYDGVGAHEQTFLAVFELSASGGTSPTVDAEVQTSFDGSVWHTVATMTQLSGVGRKDEIKPVSYVGPYVRAVVTPGGTANPEVTGVVRLASSGSLSS